MKTSWPLVVVVSLWLVGCATTKSRIIPMEGDRAQVVTSGYSESKAYDAALEEGEKYCQLRGGRFVMVKQNAEYKGMDKNAKVAVGLIGAIATPNTYTNTDSIDDNKVTIEFRCVKK